MNEPETLADRVGCNVRIAIHTHEYGTTLVLFESPQSAALWSERFAVDDVPGDEQAAAARVASTKLGLDFEPCKGETLGVLDASAVPLVAGPVSLSVCAS